MRPTFVLTGEGRSLAGQLRLLLNALVLLNERALQRHALPPLYLSGVRYVREPHGQDRWLQAPAVYRARRGDCEDLAAWRAAELRLGVDPQATADTYQTGPHRWHAVVRRGDGRIEDPSRVLGMKGGRPWRTIS